MAIIGISCIFAQSPDAKAFLHLLTRGVCAISDPPETHRHLSDYLDPDPRKPDHIYCNRGGYLPVVNFDPSEFGIPPAALEATDTSQLLGLVVAKQALNDAGYGDGKVFDRTRTSVILGVTGTQELVIPLGARLGHPIWRRALAEAGVPEDQAEAVVQRIADGYVPWQENSFPGLLGNVVAGRIANRLDLGGTNCVVDAACASSMGAIHMALLELISGRSDMVITGGVDTINDPFMHMCFSKTRILSPNGAVRPFSQAADGTLLGEGVGMVVLKRLEEAQRDGDRIYAVIKGIGSGSDGRSQSIYAPRASGQASALKRAYQMAAVPPASVELVEAHGTGTRVGDQVEFEALRDVFGDLSAGGERCALGSVKSNIGHTKAAAGTAGLIKATLALYHKVLPPTVNAQPIDPQLGVADSRFYINHALRPWVSNSASKRRAGVSAFGFGGSNFHAVLEEHDPGKLEPSWDGSVEIAAFSGKDQDALADKINQWAERVDPESGGAGIARLAAESRRQFNPEDAHRLTMVLSPADDAPHVRQLCHDAVQRLDGGVREGIAAAGAIHVGTGPPKGPLAFLFPGQGSQYVGMGRDLVCCLPGSLAAFQDAEKHFNAENPLHEYLYPRFPGDGGDDEKRLRRTDVAQPAIGAVSVAMHEALAYFGIVPEAACGHSYGELVALHAAGWIDRQGLWQLSVARGWMMAEAGAGAGDAGAMLAVAAPLQELSLVVEGLAGGVVLANRNSPGQGVLSGPATAIEAADRACREKGWKTVHLPVAAAFHSHLVADAQGPFQQVVDQVHWTPGPVPVMSNTQGAAYPRDVQAAKSLLGRQLAQPVDFVSNIENLYALGIRTFVEVGPKAVLSRLVAAILQGREFACVPVDGSAGRRFGLIDLADALARLAALGYGVRLDRWEKPLPAPRTARMRIPLSGANYRNPRPAHKQEKAPAQVRLPAATARATAAETNDSPAMPLSARPMREIMPDSKKSYFNQILGTVQQGLAAMQALQTQTTQAHQKYLEAQAEANKTLQQMIRSTRQLAGAALGLPPIESHAIHPEPSLDDALSAAQAAHRRPAPPALSDKRPSAPSVNEVLAAPDHAPAQPARMADDETSQGPPQGGPSEAETVRDNLQRIVSELTGYPVEMLGLEMDIEADLGIDSIKRVEILSSLEEQMPHLPKVTPDMMGTLKTLGQICDYLASGNETAANRENAPAAPEAVAPPPSQTGTAAVQSCLVDIVSELTGYPVEMLGLEMDIEADLGIDSIKRVEILSSLEEQMPHLPKVTPDMMGTLKTLGQICDYLASGNETAANREGAPAAPEAVAPPPAEGPTSALACAEIEVAALPPLSGAALQPPQDHYIAVIAPENGAMAGALIDAFAAAGAKASMVSNREEITPDSKLAGMVLLAPLTPVEAFQWARAGGPGLHRAARAGHAFFCTVTRLDGAFGFSGQPFGDPEQGALAGLAKTAALEWPAVRCGALDIDPRWSDDQEAARAAVAEMLHSSDHAAVEVGLHPDGRVGLQLMPVERPGPGPLDLAPEDVVVVTGGARGVTAAAVQALAAHTPCTLALVGRSPLPRPEPDWLAPLTEEGAIKKALLQHALNDQPPSPKALETAYRQWMANRDILATLDHCTQSGIRARYYSLDVRDAVAARDAMARVRSELGAVKALVHGAGVLEDRLILDKTADQFKRVYDTKVRGLQALLAATKEDDLRYLVLFSSVSARMGNTGQADYAMANEALNKMAANVSHERPHCKVISINWGPWDGGMVTASLKRTFSNHGIALIPIKQGAAAMVTEMGRQKGSVEVVLGGALPHVARQPVPAPMPESQITDRVETAMSQAARREIDLARCPVLQSHRLDGRPVVPLALMTEWLAHGALHANPGLVLHGIDHLRLLKGIALDRPKATIRLMAGNPRRKGGAYEVDVEIRNGTQNGDGIVYSRATAILTDRLPSAPAFSENGHFKAALRQPAMEDIYQHILFHGDALRGIEKIVRLTAAGMTAMIRSAPSPEQWLSEPMRSRWIGDPLVLDCAFQMAIVWCYEQRKMVCLPSYAAAYRQYRDKFPTDGVTVVLEVADATDRKMKGDFTFLDGDKKVVARLTGYEAVMDQGLFKAFGKTFFPNEVPNGSS